MSMDSETYEFVDEGSLHHYRTELPNMIYDLGLDVYEIAVYGLLKRVAGDRGTCFKSNTSICKQLGICIPKFIEVKKSLSEKALIEIVKRHHENGSPMPDLIKIMNIWPQNMEAMLARPRNIKDGSSQSLGGVVNGIKGGSKPGLGGVVNGIKGGSKQRLVKEEPHEEDHKEEQQQGTAPPPPPAAAVSPKMKEQEKQDDQKVYLCLRGIDISLSDKFEITKRYSEDTVKNAIAWALHDETKIAKGLAPAIKWACRTKPEVPKNPINQVSINRDYANYCEKQYPKSVEARPNAIVILFVGCQKAPIEIPYSSKGFIDQVHNALSKAALRPPQNKTKENL